MSASVILNFSDVHYRLYLLGWIAASCIHVPPPSAEDSTTIAAYALGVQDGRKSEPVADFSVVASRVTKLLTS
jgi:hypothetical protein